MLQEVIKYRSIRTCFLQDVTLYEVNKNLSLTGRHVIWGQ